MHSLAREMLERPDHLLKRFVALSVALCQAGSAGISLLRTQPEGDAVFFWAALAGAFDPYEGGSTPRNFSPCGVCLDRGEPILLSYPARVFTYFSEVPTPIVEGLIVPLYGVNRQPLGTIWILAHDEQRKFDRTDVRLMQRLADFTALALEMSELVAAQGQLIRELDHRVKNTLAAVQSVARQSLGESEESHSFVGRLAAFARAHSLLAQGQWEGVSLRTLIELELEAYHTKGGERITLDGPDLLLNARVTQGLGLVLHELATNAAKYGALSAQAGRLHLRWRIQADASRRLRLQWIESNGPAVRPPNRKGFGSRMIERTFAYEMGGTARLDFRPEGLTCTIDLPLPDTPLGTPAAAGPTAVAGDGTGEPDVSGLAGKRILVVEDMMLAAMELDELLLRSGCEVVGPAARLPQALALAEREALDAAVLDVDLDGAKVFPVAEALRRRGTPFVFMTGYGEAADWPDEFRNDRRVAKPVQAGELLAALALGIADRRAPTRA